MARRRRINAYSNLGSVAFAEERPARQLAEAGPAGEESPGGPARLPEIARRLAASQAGEATQGQPGPVPGRRYRAENGEAFTLIRLDGETAIVRFAGEAHDEQHPLRRLGRLSELRQGETLAARRATAPSLPAIIPAGGFPHRVAEAAQAVMRAAPVAALLAGALAIGFIFTRTIFGAGL